MKKGIFAALMAVLLVFAAITPAFGADLSSNEQVPYDKFCSVVDKWTGVIGTDTANQYKSEAKSALLKVDLSATACDEFSTVVTKVDEILTAANPKTRPEMREKCLADCLAVVNGTANKYGMNVQVGAHGYATVTVTLPDSNSSSGTKTTTVASTAKSVKQTGSGLAQTAVVVMASVATLAGAFTVARKNRLFA